MTETDNSGYLEGKCLIATPAMPDNRFDKSVIYLCAHSEQGAMGIVINKPAGHLNFSELLTQLEIESASPLPDIGIHFGGPVNTDRGFVLHSLDYEGPDTLTGPGQTTGMTATIDVLRALAEGRGPQKSLVALGYAGWMPGQLEGELVGNGWLTCDADETLLFDGDDDEKWRLAINKLGIDPALLFSQGGMA